MYVVYRNPSDYPDKFVVRHYVVISGAVLVEDGPPMAVVDTLEDARGSIATTAGELVRLPRHKDDDPVIVEVWV